MSCKSALYAANTTPQALPINSVISFGSIVRRFGSNFNLSGGNLVAMGAGYFDLDAAFNVFGTATGNATITLYKDGVAIPGATQTVGVADGSRTNVTIPVIIRNNCCRDITITAVLTGAGATINTATIAAEKI